ncbi:MAG TPA: right-handed parallel beta-helix repeat-containing protein [Thermoanaerobaculia bacterium]|nr:right-handed parallel beta-helix repeat-containing protein [Thermoanaerobaculia bacterium]
MFGSAAPRSYTSFGICRLVLSIVFVFTASATFAKEKLIIVDCNNKSKINDALLDTSPELRIEFSGICQEDVRITRSNTTLAGKPGARIVGATVPLEQRQPGVAIHGARNVNLIGFEIQDSDFRGIEMRTSTAAIEGLTVTGSRTGLLLIEQSFASVRNSSFNGNIGDGIGVWDNSAIVLQGPVSANGNSRVGVLVSNGSSLTLGPAGVSLTANGNLFGYAVQVAASAQLGSAGPTSVEAVGNSVLGALISQTSSWAGRLTARDSELCVEVDGSAFESLGGGFTASGCTFGVFGWLDSFVWLGGSNVSGTEFGVYLDGATGQITNATFTGNTSEDVHAEFGSKVSFNGTNQACNVFVDETSIRRGNTTCPPDPELQVSSIGARQGKGAAYGGIRRTATEPLSLEP